MKKNEILQEEIAGGQIPENGFDLIRIQTNENEEQVVSGRELHELEIQYRRGGTWLLYQKYSGFGYTKSTTFADEKTGFSKMSTKWTQKGRLFLYETLKANGILPVIEQ